MASEIVVDKLVKRFGHATAVDAISFSVDQRETVGLLGPNGAGKTTTMRILAGLSPADGGTVQLAGLDARTQGREVRRLLGVVTQQDGLDVEISVRENLTVYGYLCGLSRQASATRADAVLAFFGLEGRANDEVDALSGGMKRRLAIARAWMTRPRIIILDEPSTGLDPHSRARVWENLAELKAGGVTVLMSTHYMEEAAVLCDRVAIMDRGRILALGPPRALIAEHAGRGAIEIRCDEAQRDAVRAALTAIAIPWREMGAVFSLPDEGADLGPVATLAGVQVHHRPAHLEDVFLRLTGKELVDD